MDILKTQNEFVRAIALLILFACQKGYAITFGDTTARDGHKKDSLHYKRCAIDLNLFRDGKYLNKTEDHAELGKFWESLHPRCRWGGRFNDGNHYEMVPGQEEL